MGLFSFIKNAGERLFPSAPEEAPAAEAPVLSQEEIDSQKADQLLAAVQRHELRIDSLYVAVEGDLATIAGTAANQAEKEKAILVVGNVNGIAEVDDQIKVENVVQSQFHTVVSGDTLGKIAKNYYGDAMKYPVIFEANKPMLSHPDKIYVGQVLRIPAVA